MPGQQRQFDSVCFVVAVDDHWFLGRGLEDDWVDKPQWAQKYSKLRLASGRAEDEKERHPSRNIRPVICKQYFVVEEVV